MRRTKITATIGPAWDTQDGITTMLNTGVNIIRFNMKHVTKEWHDERIPLVRSVSATLHKPVAILIDLQGPEIRVETANKQDVPFKSGETVHFSLTPAGERDIVIPTKEVFTAIKPGHVVLIDDGSVELTVTATTPTTFDATISEDYTVKHRKSLNMPGIDIDLAAMTDDDYQKLEMKNIKMVDIVALSFTRSKKDVEHLRGEMDKRGIKAWICAKIENQMALDNLEEIVEASDCVMVARGDLGVETPLEMLAYNQKRIIKMCREKNKPVITATQMLHSMVNNPRPTRAEMCDVANAVYDGTDATMLSEESAMGKYAVKCVQTMGKILEFTETVVPQPATNRFDEIMH
ncbi:pyruvate kinase [Candidatus Cerribacteria bacterium 'Amazon FNV 2010 28 9']|uniref:Pyruvate kinase n=1 Tax=Candidatus Cerribacteria bacterium 'Amazon FNV 2010 28 9' TaxID=2081795 RepID=A0A317JP50_9BACT|nr:MAG: pyruvate kinase [Candidatus Cerribacteria bacterium 'Amazon FNV 2010 28 9']